jgi:hypothetical protein
MPDNDKNHILLQTLECDCEPCKVFAKEHFKAAVEDAIECMKENGYTVWEQAADEMQKKYGLTRDEAIMFAHTRMHADEQGDLDNFLATLDPARLTDSRIANFYLAGHIREQHHRTQNAPAELAEVLARLIKQGSAQVIQIPKPQDDEDEGGASA